MIYDAFVSYSHSADGKLAPAVQSALKRLAKPWYRLRLLHVFRDETNLSAASDLTGAIRAALTNSRFFVYLGSPDAVTSKWVGSEIDIWRKNNPPETLLIVVTEGEIEWDDTRQDFNWEKSTALHPKLKGFFPKVPLWVDLRWARREEHFSSHDPRFQRAIAMLAAPMHGKTLDELVGEDVRQQRITRITTGAVIGVLTLLLAVSIVATLVATKTSQNLERKIELISSMLPVFGDEGSDEETTVQPSFLERLWLRFDTQYLWPAEIEEWVDWGPDRLALREDCSGPPRDRYSAIDCPASAASFAEDGFRSDIPGLSEISKEIVAALGEGRLKKVVAIESEDTDAEMDEFNFSTIISHLGILIPAMVWEGMSTGALKDVIGGTPRLESDFTSYFNIWRKSLQGAELIALHLVNTGYCGSGGCTSPTLFFIRVGQKYRLILVTLLADEFVVYDMGGDNMPQIFGINASQAGAYDQYRIINRYDFDNECMCYLHYLKGNITSTAPSFSRDRRIPQSLE